METLSCSLSLAFLAEVTGRGYQREGFSGFLRAVTERAIARSVDCECPISAATSDSLRAIALRLGNSLPYTDTNRLVPRPFFTLDPYDWERVLITQYGSTSLQGFRKSLRACGLYNTVDPIIIHVHTRSSCASAEAHRAAHRARLLSRSLSKTAPSVSLLWRFSSTSLPFLLSTSFQSRLTVCVCTDSISTATDF